MCTKLVTFWSNLQSPGIEKLKVDISNGTVVESISVGEDSKRDAWALEYYLTSDANLDFQKWKFKCLHGYEDGNPVPETHHLYLELKNDQWTGCLDSSPLALFTLTKYIDISSTPFTNYFPIRELIQNGKLEATFKVLYVEIPTLKISFKNQTYKKLGPKKFSYRSEGSPAVYMIEVDDNGIPIVYDNLWQGIIE